MPSAAKAAANRLELLRMDAMPSSGVVRLQGVVAGYTEGRRLHHIVFIGRGGRRWRTGSARVTRRDLI